MTKAKERPTSLVSLDDLKRQYNELESALGDLTRTKAEKYFAQGKILQQIKEHTGLKHGDWIPWCEKNLKVNVRNIQMRLNVVELKHIPKNDEIVVFGLYELSEVGKIVKSEKLSPEAAVTKYLANQQKRIDDAIRKAKKAGRAGAGPKINKRPRSTGKASYEDALEFFGLSSEHPGFVEGLRGKTAAEILFRGWRQKLHPDKGGSNAEFVKCTKMMELINEHSN